MKMSLLFEDDEVNLASSTVTAEHSSATGFIISYVARVKLDLGSMAGELVADVPFKLMHPTPGMYINIFIHKYFCLYLVYVTKLFYL